MKYFLCSLVLSLSLFHIASSQCTFPNVLTGMWESPVKGNLTFNSTHMTGYDIYTYTGLEFECHNKSGSKYVLRSGDFDVLGNSVNAAMCWDLAKVTTNIYKYFQITSELADANNERVKFIQASSGVTDVLDICDETTIGDTVQNTKLLVKYGEAVNESIQCPDEILGQYWHYNNTYSCLTNTSYWDVCTNLNQMVFDYTTCSEVQAYSTNGTVDCIFSEVSGDEIVVYTYNLDDTVDNNSSYRYTCMVIDKNDTSGFVYVSQNPQECYGNQTSTYVPSDGTTIVLEAEKTCIPTTSKAEESVSQAGLVAGMAILAIILVAAVGAVVGYYIYTKKFKKVDPNDKRVIDKEQEHRATDAVTPSVVQTDLQSPKTSGSHGKRRHKRIGIKRVSGPVVPLPPDDSRISVHTRRRRLEKLSLITPRTLTRGSSRQQLTTPDEPDAPKVNIAPPPLQLPLAREETLTTMSRCSTILEEAIGIEIYGESPSKKPQTPRIPITPKTPKKPQTPRTLNLPQTPKKPQTPRTLKIPQTQKTPKKPQTPKTPNVPQTPKTPGRPTRSRPSITRQSNKSQRSSSRNSNVPNRKLPTLSVKPLDGSKNKYVKYAKAVFKDGGTIYRKKVKLVGKIQKRRPSSTNKPIRLKEMRKETPAPPTPIKVEKKETKTSDFNMLAIDIISELNKPEVIKIESPKTEPKPVFEFDKIRELDRPKDKIEIHVQEAEIKADNQTVESPRKEKVIEADKFIYDKSDENFFMNDNDDDDFYKEFMEKRKREHEAKLARFNATQVPFVKQRTRNDKPKAEPNGLKSSGLAKLMANVESVARFSALRKKFSNLKKTKESDKRSDIEQKVLSSVYYNKNGRTQSQLQQRSRQNVRTMNLSRTYERIPTLVNWVECSDLLSTPAMRMQTKIQNGDIRFDAVRNERFVFR